MPAALTGTVVVYAYAGAAFGRSSGWHGGWFELKDQFGDRVAGGEVDGVVEGEKLQVDFVVEEGNMEVGCICRSPCSNKYMRGGRERTDERWHCETRNSQECDMEMFDIRNDGRRQLRECTVFVMKISHAVHRLPSHGRDSSCSQKPAGRI